MNDNSGVSGNKLSPRIIPRDAHTMSRQQVSPNALRVLYRLKDAGFQAFLVGGCVRDILLGRTPKDFDVATNALPEEVRHLFRNCRLIGRRFRLAHVIFGQEIIEVATFRSSGAPSLDDEPSHDEEAESDDRESDSDESVVADEEPIVASEHRVLDAGGRILRDNIYGSIDDDVWRRDFACNALYYNIADFSIWDYVDGMADIAARRLRLIGDPVTRYREDPVRMLRAARFEAKLGFELDAASLAPIDEHGGLLANVPPARLFDEINKLFLTGHGRASLPVLRRHGLLRVILPAVEDFLVRHPGSPVEKLLLNGLANTDLRVQSDKPVTPVFLFALLLYGPIAAYIETLPRERWDDPQSILDGCDRALRQAHQRVTIPRRIALGVREMFALQPRLENPRGRRALRLLEQSRFRAAYDLFLLRAQVGMAAPEVARWWTDLQAASPEQREALASRLGSGGGGRDAADESDALGAGGDSAGTGPDGRRRRRRRGGRGRRRGGAGARVD